MTAILMNGSELAARVRAQVAEEVRELGHVALATVLVGDDPASEVYVGYKHKDCGEVGIESIDHRLPDGASEEQVLTLVRELNVDENVDGFIVQSPVPAQISEPRVMEAIDPIKDVDGFSPSTSAASGSGARATSRPHRSGSWRCSAPTTSSWKAQTP